MFTTGPTVEGTRTHVLDLLLHRGRSTVADLAEALGLTQGAVRRHLDRLRADGLVDVDLLRQDMGRPLYIYFPTRAAEESHAHYERLTERFVREVGALQPEQLKELSGEALLASVFHGIGRRVANEHRAEVSGPEIGQRVIEVTEVLREEGILSGWSRTDDGYRLVNVTCPYRRAADASAAACTMDREVIEELLGSPVDQVGRLVDGKSHCEYIVRAVREQAGAPEKTAEN